MDTFAHETVSRILKNVRQQAGMTQKQLADRLDRPQSFVAKYERGERRLDVVEFAKIARKLGVSPAHLFAQILRHV
jgi:transcriptional regulator with XRE-family HTH domain